MLDIGLIIQGCRNLYPLLILPQISVDSMNLIHLFGCPFIFKLLHKEYILHKHFLIYHTLNEIHIVYLEYNFQTFLRNFDEPGPRQTQLIIARELSPADNFEVLQ